MTALDELKALLLKHARADDYATAIPRLRLPRSDGPTRPNGALYEAALCLIVQGAKATAVGERVHRYEAGQFLIAAVDVPVMGCIVDASSDAPYLAVSVGLDPALVSSLLLEGAPVPPAPVEGMAVATADDALIDALLRMVRLLDRPGDAPMLAPLIEREIVYRLLTSDQGARLRQIGRPDTAASRINRALRWLRTHFAEPMRIDDLARLAGMSASAFHRHFKAVTTLTPLQYQKQLRLQEARRRLLIRQADVASIGLAVGYDSASQFSREYHRQFGAPPGRDAERLREEVLLSAA